MSGKQLNSPSSVPSLPSPAQLNLRAGIPVPTFPWPALSPVLSPCPVTLSPALSPSTHHQCRSPRQVPPDGREVEGGHGSHEPLRRDRDK